MVANGSRRLAGIALRRPGAEGILQAGRRRYKRPLVSEVSVAQLAEHRIVIPRAVGSSPITHPLNEGL